MATSWNYEAAASTKSIAVPDIDYSQFGATGRGAGSEIKLRNMTSPPDRVETVRYSIDNVANVYNGTEIEPSYYATSKAGKSLLIEVADILTYEETVGSVLTRQDLPIKAHMVVKFPTNVNVTGSVVLTTVERLLSLALATGTVTAERLEALIRGVLLPTNIG